MTDPSRDAHADQPTLLWPAAATIAAFGSWMLFDALPGINWILWTGPAALGLLTFAWPREGARRPALIMGAAATAIAGAAAVTASPPLSALICLGVMFFLSMQMLVTAAPHFRAVTVTFAAIAPLVALQQAALQSLRRSVDATRLIRSSRTRAWVRGVVITLPVMVVFAMLLAEADPTFAHWRDAIGTLFANWDFVPRVVFFGMLLVIVLGAYGYAALSSTTLAAPRDDYNRWLGSTERIMLLASVAALFWLFLAIQLGYLFGNLPSTAASGVTFAEYARRGFGELTVVASASTFLIVGSERYGNGDRKQIVRVLTFIVIAAVLLLLASAFRRVLLYEAAYGFTTARLYAQTFMCAVGAGLVMLSLEVAGDFDAGRLFRRTGAAVTILFIALMYWNHESWIATKNIDRWTHSGKLDVAYLTESLGPDAVPAIVDALPSLPEPLRSEIRSAVLKRSAARPKGRQREWFEWNLASERARRSVERS